MLNVWCVWWRDPKAPDKYTPYHVQRLQRSVFENLSEEHQFICVTDQPIVNCWKVEPIVSYPGWWQKISLFAPGFPLSERNLYLDLDVVVTGSLDPIAAYADRELAACANWAQSGHGGIQSSVFAWNGQLHTPFTGFDPAWAHWPPVNRNGVYWGDQEVLTAMRDRGEIDWTPIEPQLVRSYKYHCRAGLPDDCRVAVFHGDPKPERVSESWFTW